MSGNSGNVRPLILIDLEQFHRLEQKSQKLNVLGQKHRELLNQDEERRKREKVIEHEEKRPDVAPAMSLEGGAALATIEEKAGEVIVGGEKDESKNNLLQRSKIAKIIEEKNNEIKPDAGAGSNPENHNPWWCIL